jgi:hypothetical protein
MEAGKNSVIYLGLISGPNKADDTCGRTTVTGTMDRGFTVLCICKLFVLAIRAYYIARNEQYQNKSGTVTSYSQALI